MNDDDDYVSFYCNQMLLDMVVKISCFSDLSPEFQYGDVIKYYGVYWYHSVVGW